jgi:hypothetical protein
MKLLMIFTRIFINLLVVTPFMDADLVQRLRDRNLFPLEIDECAKSRCRELGIDPSKLETHYSPGTPRHVIDRYERIHSDVLRLHEIDNGGASVSGEYKRLTSQLELDLFELVHPTVEDVLYKHSHSTGVVGVNRDIGG